MRRCLRLLGIALAMASPTLAQFGVGGKRKASNFQELNEQAKQMQQGGAGGDTGAAAGWADAMAAFSDPEMMKQMEAAMKQLQDMSPEELQKQMEDAMKMLSEGDLMKGMIENMDKDEVLKYLAESGMVPPEELAKMRTDQEYFEEKLAESMESMMKIFTDPEILKGASAMMEGMKDVMNNPGKIDEMMGSLLGAGQTDEQIEEARLQILSNPEALGPMAEMFQTPEMQAILKDPKKWRESVQEGKGMLGLGAGAGVGEL